MRYKIKVVYKKEDITFITHFSALADSVEEAINKVNLEAVKYVTRVNGVLSSVIHEN